MKYLLPFLCVTAKIASASDACDTSKQDDCTNAHTLMNETARAFGSGDPALKRLKQMKALILHLQPAHYYAKYCNYGCWCFRDGVHQVGTGSGPAVDAIDQKCLLQAKCYECAEMEHPNRNCVPEQIQYDYSLIFDPNDPDNHNLKSIVCHDDPFDPNTGKTSEKISCRRAICECDKRLAEDLRAMEAQNIWVEENSQKIGSFDPDTQCIHTRGGANSGDKNWEMKCCGTGWRFPYRDSDNRKCCGDMTYDANMLTCCNDVVSTIGTC
jgi:hypothetical protein